MQDFYVKVWNNFKILFIKEVYYNRKMNPLGCVRMQILREKALSDDSKPRKS